MTPESSLDFDLGLMVRAGDDVVHGDVAVVLDVLHLLPVPWGLLQGLDDQGSCGGNHRHLGLTILDGELDSDLETFPLLGGLGDVVTNLLGRQTEGTDLGGKGRGGGNFTSNGPQAHDLDFSGIELGWHLGSGLRLTSGELNVSEIRWWMRAQVRHSTTVKKLHLFAVKSELKKPPC